MTYTIDAHQNEEGYFLTITRATNNKNAPTTIRIVTARDLNDLASRLEIEAMKAPRVFEVRYFDGISQTDLRNRMRK
ncbi:hypothetical protein J4467_01850 [Candidatus Woesearchaeota archaeon]|nr:hypothetical protein [Candidatus Woesearchaeota archaeon]